MNVRLKSEGRGDAGHAVVPRNENNALAEPPGARLALDEALTRQANETTRRYTSRENAIRIGEGTVDAWRLARHRKSPIVIVAISVNIAIVSIVQSSSWFTPIAPMRTTSNALR
jgi:hypothetical protein